MPFISLPATALPFPAIPEIGNKENHPDPLSQVDQENR
jgi:hypothetical protein